MSTIKIKQVKSRIGALQIRRKLWMHWVFVN